MVRAIAIASHSWAASMCWEHIPAQPPKSCSQAPAQACNKHIMQAQVAAKHGPTILGNARFRQARGERAILSFATL